MQVEKRAVRAAVATPHVEAAIAAERIFRGGGNAIDASVAAMMTLCVVMPGMVGLGGFGATMVIWLARERRAVAIDSAAPAPLRFSPDLVAGDPKRFERGPLSISVPTVLAGLDAALRQFGTRSWADVCAHALHLAEHGVPMYPQLHEHMHHWRGRADAASVEALLGKGDVPEMGELFVQKDLARLLRRIMAEGPAALHEGEVPRQICRHIQNAGGILCEEDFQSCKASTVEPLAVPYRGHELLTPPPPSGGITTCGILKTLEHFDFSGRNSEYFHTFAEATKLCWHERDAILGDPDFVDVPRQRLIGEAGARQRADRIRSQNPLPPRQAEHSPHHTANVVAADDEGNVISLHATQGAKFGSCFVVPGLGLLMNHGMSRFSFAPGSPNFPAPGKRVQHNMAPLLIGRGGRPRFAIGLPGGPRIITVTAHLAAHLLDFHATPGEAAVAPRLHVEADEPLLVMRDFPESIIEELRARGHQVNYADELGGPANVLRIEDDKSLLAATGAGADSIAAL